MTVQPYIHLAINVDTASLSIAADTLADAGIILDNVAGSLRLFRESAGFTRVQLHAHLHARFGVEAISLTESVLGAIEAGHRSPALDEAILLLSWMRSFPVADGRYTGTESNHSDPESETP